jgi:hypothetical protein
VGVSAFARILSRAIVIAASLATTLAARPASAADDAAAEALISRGIELRENQKDDEALVLFRQAFAKSPTPRARAQVALAEQALGLWGSAAADLDAALAEVSDPWIAKHRAALEGALAVVRRHLGTLDVRGNDGAEVFLDGVRLGALPSAAFRVEAGTRRLELRRAGFHPATRTVEVPAGGVARETLTLVTDASSPEGIEGGGGERAADPGRGQRVFGYVLGGIGVAMLGVGTTAVLMREGEKGAYNDDVDAKSCPGIGKTQPKPCDDRLEKIRTFLTVGVTSYVAGGVFLIGGVVVLVTAPSASPRAASARPTGLAVRCAPGWMPSEASLVCAGVF